MGNIIKLYVLLISIIFISSCGLNNKDIKTKENLNDIIVDNIIVDNIIVDTSNLYSTGVQNIINIQLEKGTDEVLNLDCSSFDKEGTKYCEKEQNKIKELQQEKTWESILNQGNDYIITFDCNEIMQDIGKKYCEEYKLIIQKNILNNSKIENNTKK